MSAIANTFLIAILTVGAVGSAYFAYRERQRMLAMKSSFVLRKNVMEDCDAILGDSKASKNLKLFVSHVAVLAASSYFLEILGTDSELFRLTPEELDEMRRAGVEMPYEKLNAQERDRVRPMIVKFSFASLAFNRNHSRAVRYMIAEGTIDAMIDEVLKHEDKRHAASTRRTEAVAEVSSRVPQVERLVASDMCFA